MASQRIKTKYVGVYYREIAEVGGKGTEKMFYVTFKKAGKTFEVKVGSDKRDAMTPARANTKRAEFIQGRLQTPAEKAAAALKPENKSFSEYFTEVYFPAIQDRKKPKSITREESLFRLWIEPAFGRRRMPDVSDVDIERLKSNMHKAGKAARTLVYALAIVRQVFHHAGLKSPGMTGRKGSQDKRLKADNRRLRYLTANEAEMLLADLKTRSQSLYEQALVSLHMGLRAGELFALAWGDVDMDRGVLVLRDPKGVDSRTVFMTETVRQMFREKLRREPSALVWPARAQGKEKCIRQISSVFDNAVDALRLNEGVTDRRQKVVFHTLRHSCASFLVNNEVPIYTVQHVLGHKNVATTARYAKVSPETMRRAAQVLERSISGPDAAPDVAADAS
jgi:integrase